MLCDDEGMLNPRRSGGLRVIKIGMHERGANGGVDRVFWDLFDNLSAFPELKLKAFYFRHQAVAVGSAENEQCLGSTGLPGYRRLWNLRRAVIPELRTAAGGPSVVASHFA